MSRSDEEYALLLHERNVLREALELSQAENDALRNLIDVFRAELAVIKSNLGQIVADLRANVEDKS